MGRGEGEQSDESVVPLCSLIGVLVDLSQRVPREHNLLILPKQHPPTHPVERDIIIERGEELQVDNRAANNNEETDDDISENCRCNITITPIVVDYMSAGGKRFRADKRFSRQ